MQNDDNRCNMYPLAKSTFFWFAFVCSHNGVKWTVGRHFLLFTRLFQLFSVNLYKEYTYLKSKELDAKLKFLPRIQTERHNEDSNVMIVLRKLPYQWFGG